MGLLVMQSMSSFVLENYKDLIQQHLVVTLFLTMLVGAGGNAGNQSAIQVIRGLATGQLSTTGRCVKRTLLQQSRVGLLLAVGLSVVGFLRVWLSTGSALSALAISSALFLIVLFSVVIGTALPFALARLGGDAVNAGTSIQVIMDILGVVITCATCNFILGQFYEEIKTVEHPPFHDAN